MEQYTVLKARIHLELGVVLGIRPLPIGPLNLRLAMGVRVLLLILQLRAVCPQPFFSKDEQVLLKYTRVDSTAHIGWFYNVLQNYYANLAEHEYLGDEVYLCCKMYSLRHTFPCHQH
jgi:hypothetical protein